VKGDEGMGWGREGDATPGVGRGGCGKEQSRSQMGGVGGSSRYTCCREEF